GAGYFRDVSRFRGCCNHYPDVHRCLSLRFPAGTGGCRSCKGHSALDVTSAKLRNELVLSARCLLQLEPVSRRGSPEMRYHRFRIRDCPEPARRWLTPSQPILQSPGIRLPVSSFGAMVSFEGEVAMETLKDKAAIVGIGHTEYSRNSGRSEMSLAVEAIRNAIADAGLKPTDIDGIAKYSMDNNSEI